METQTTPFTHKISNEWWNCKEKKNEKKENEEQWETMVKVLADMFGEWRRGNVVEILFRMIELRAEKFQFPWLGGCEFQNVTPFRHRQSFWGAGGKEMNTMGNDL